MIRSRHDRHHHDHHSHHHDHHDYAHAHDHGGPAPGGDGAGLRVLIRTFAVLGVTALLQAGVAAISGSVALLADAVHNLADAATALPLALALRVGRRAPTRRFTYGYGRVEDLAGIVIALAVAGSAAFAVVEAVGRIARPHVVHHVPWVVLAGTLGVIGNEIVAVHRIRVGRSIGSAALEADGLHARADGLASGAVVLGAIASAAGWRAADPIVGLAIGGALLLVTRRAVAGVCARLMDAVDPELTDRVQRIVGSVPGVREVDRARVRWVGHALRAEVDVTTARELTLLGAADIADAARQALLAGLPRLTDAAIRTRPSPA